MEQMSSQGLNRDIRVRVTEERRRQVDALAAYRKARGDGDGDVSDVIRDALEEYLDEHRPPEAFLDSVEGK